MSLLLTNDSPSIHTLGHLPPLPLVIEYSDRTTGTTARKNEDSVHLGLQQCGRVHRIALRAPSSSLRTWLEPMNNLFPRLKDLILLSTDIEEMSLMLPETLQAPDLRRLLLHGIGLPKGWPLLSSAIALSTLSLTNIGASCYFSPGHLVTQLQGLPHLEELSIGFAIRIPLPSSEQQLLLAPIPPVTLPSLRRLTFHGVDAYLDNLVAQINTPLLERLSLAFFFNLSFILVNLTKFICRTEGFGCLVARIVFDKEGASIDTGHYEQWDIGRLSLRVNCEPLERQVESATQVCIALGNVLYAVEELTLDLNGGGMAADWEDTLDNPLWHELLLPFIGVKKLHIGPSLTFELSRALESVAGGLVLGLLPELRELEIQLEVNRAKTAFSVFTETRESIGRPIHLLTTGGSSSSRSASSSSRSASSSSRGTSSSSRALPYGATRGGPHGATRSGLRGATRGGLRSATRGASRGASRGSTRGATRGTTRGASASRRATRRATRGAARGAPSVPRRATRGTTRGTTRGATRGATRRATRGP